MNKRLILIVVVAAGLAVAWTAFAASGAGAARSSGAAGAQNVSAEERAKMRERFQNMSEEERAKFREDMRARFENMSEEERAQMRSRFGGGTRMSREEQLKSIKAVEEQLAKLKASIESSARPADANFSALSEEERAKLRDQFTKAREARQTAIDAIRAEIDKLSPPRPALMEAVRELRDIRALAEKEKATETAKRLDSLIEKQSQQLPQFGPGRGPQVPGAGTPGTPGTSGAPGGERTPRRPRTEGAGTP